MTTGAISWRTWQQPTAVPMKDLASRYDEIANRWHTLIQRLGYLRAYQALFTSLAAQSVIPTSGRVVDCGIGSGGLSLGLLQATSNAWHVEGVDISAHMLHEATLFLADAASLSLHCADATWLPQADDMADLVISAHMLEHLPDPVAALREMRRVLKPGGTVVVVITRKGLWGSYIRRKWGVTCVAEADACGWLWEAGFSSVRSAPMRNLLLPCTWSSVVCVGQK